MTEASWSGRQVLVTGGEGFIGSTLVDHLLQQGATVRAYVHYKPYGSAGYLAGREDDVEIVAGDVRDANRVAEAVRGCHTVFHLAALIGIPYSYVAPESYIQTNVIGTYNVVNACRWQGARMVHTSTSETYGTAQYTPIDELHPLQGQSPYSASKIGADKMAESYARSFDLPVTTLRPFNTFGPRQSTRAVIPTVLSQMIAGASEIRLGDVTPKRDFTFVTDTADGFVRAALCDVPPGTTIQLGTGRTVSVGEVVDLCKKVTASEADIVTEEARIRPEASEVQILLSDPSLAHEVLGWAPSVSLEQGLAATAEWLRPRVDPDTAARYHR